MFAVHPQQESLVIFAQALMEIGPGFTAVKYSRDKRKQ